MVAWPEGIHHVLALPQEQQPGEQNQNEEPSKQADDAVLHPHDDQISKSDDKEEHGQIDQRNGDQPKSQHLIVKNNLKAFQNAGFWECLTHPAYTDLDLIMQDDRLPVNRLTHIFLKLILLYCLLAGPPWLLCHQICQHCSTLRMTP